ncbi:MAG: T9SS type A sorting domain-containing protein [Marinirhabdus sp.]
MKKITLLAALFAAFTTYAQDMIITGTFDGPLPGGLPKAIEIYVVNDIADLATYGIGSANNGGGTDGVEDVFAGTATAGDYLYIASEDVEFMNFFGFAPTFVGGSASINGDDAIELFDNVIDDGTGTGTFIGDVIDTFGFIDVDGTGQTWEYLDGWAYRNDMTGPDGSTFVEASWTFSGVDENDDDTTHATATNPWPIGTYEPSLGVNDVEQNNFTIYPNPAAGNTVTISSARGNGAMQVAVFDVLGKQVMNTVTSNTLDISTLKSGMYILQIAQGTNTAIKKLVVR